MYLLLQVFVCGVSVLWVVEFLLEDGMRQNAVLHIALQSYNNNNNNTMMSELSGRCTCSKRNSPVTADFSLSSRDCNSALLRSDRLT